MGRRGDSSRFRATATVMHVRDVEDVQAVVGVRELTDELHVQPVPESSLGILLLEAQDRRGVLRRLIWGEEKE